MLPLVLRRYPWSSSKLRPAVPPAGSQRLPPPSPPACCIHPPPYTLRRLDSAGLPRAVWVSMSLLEWLQKQSTTRLKNSPSERFGMIE